MSGFTRGGLKKMSKNKPAADAAVRAVHRSTETSSSLPLSPHYQAHMQRRARAQDSQLFLSMQVKLMQYRRFQRFMRRLPVMSSGTTPPSWTSSTMLFPVVHGSSATAGSETLEGANAMAHDSSFPPFPSSSSSSVPPFATALLHRSGTSSNVEFAWNEVPQDIKGRLMALAVMQQRLAKHLHTLYQQEREMKNVKKDSHLRAPLHSTGSLTREEGVGTEIQELERLVSQPLCSFPIPQLRLKRPMPRPGDHSFTGALDPDQNAQHPSSEAQEGVLFLPDFSNHQLTLSLGGGGYRALQKTSRVSTDVVPTLPPISWSAAIPLIIHHTRTPRGVSQVPTYYVLGVRTSQAFIPYRTSTPSSSPAQEERSLPRGDDSTEAPQCSSEWKSFSHFIRYWIAFDGESQQLILRRTCATGRNGRTSRKNNDFEVCSAAPPSSQQKPSQPPKPMTHSASGNETSWKDSEDDADAFLLQGYELNAFDAYRSAQAARMGKSQRPAPAMVKTAGEDLSTRREEEVQPGTGRATVCEATASSSFELYFLFPDLAESGGGSSQVMEPPTGLKQSVKSSISSKKVFLSQDSNSVSSASARADHSSRTATATGRLSNEAMRGARLLDATPPGVALFDSFFFQSFAFWRATADVPVRGSSASTISSRGHAPSAAPAWPSWTPIKQKKIVLVDPFSSPDAASMTGAPHHSVDTEPAASVQPTKTKEEKLQQAEEHAEELRDLFLRYTQQRLRQLRNAPSTSVAAGLPHQEAEHARLSTTSVRDDGGDGGVSARADLLTTTASTPDVEETAEFNSKALRVPIRVAMAVPWSATLQALTVPLLLRSTTTTTFLSSQDESIPSLTLPRVPSDVPARPASPSGPPPPPVLPHRRVAAAIPMKDRAGLNSASLAHSFDSLSSSSSLLSCAFPWWWFGGVPPPLPRPPLPAAECPAPAFPVSVLEAGLHVMERLLLPLLRQPRWEGEATCCARGSRAPLDESPPQQDTVTPAAVRQLSIKRKNSLSPWDTAEVERSRSREWTPALWTQGGLEEYFLKCATAAVQPPPLPSDMMTLPSACPRHCALWDREHFRQLVLAPGLLTAVEKPQLRWRDTFEPVQLRRGTLHGTADDSAASSSAAAAAHQEPIEDSMRREKRRHQHHEEVMREESEIADRLVLFVHDIPFIESVLLPLMRSYAIQHGCWFPAKQQSPSRCALTGKLFGCPHDEGDAARGNAPPAMHTNGAVPVLYKSEQLGVKPSCTADASSSWLSVQDWLALQRHVQRLQAYPGRRTPYLREERTATSRNSTRQTNSRADNNDTKTHSNIEEKERKEAAVEEDGLLYDRAKFHKMKQVSWWPRGLYRKAAAVVPASSSSCGPQEESRATPTPLAVSSSSLGPLAATTTTQRRRRRETDYFARSPAEVSGVIPLRSFLEWAMCEECPSLARGCSPPGGGPRLLVCSEGRSGTATSAWTRLEDYPASDFTFHFRAKDVLRLMRYFAAYPQYFDITLGKGQTVGFFYSPSSSSTQQRQRTPPATTPSSFHPEKVSRILTPTTTSATAVPTSSMPTTTTTCPRASVGVSCPTDPTSLPTKGVRNGSLLNSSAAPSVLSLSRRDVSAVKGNDANAKKTVKNTKKQRKQRKDKKSRKK